MALIVRRKYFIRTWVLNEEKVLYKNMGLKVRRIVSYIDGTT